MPITCHVVICFYLRHIVPCQRSLARTDSVLKRSLVVVYLVFLSVQLFFLQFSFQQSTAQCTCSRLIILTLTDHLCQHWLKKKLPSSDLVPQVPCFPSPPSGTLIAAYQAEEQSTASQASGCGKVVTQRDHRSGHQSGQRSTFGRRRHGGSAEPVHESITTSTMQAEYARAH